MARTNLHTGTTNMFPVKNIAHYTAWMNNYFDFQSASLPQVLAEISRWYGVKLSAASPADAAISASYSRDTDLTEILRSLEQLSGVKINRQP